MHIVTTTYQPAEAAVGSSPARPAASSTCWPHGSPRATAPPTWTWWIGFGWRASLGTLLWRLGQATTGRAVESPMSLRMPAVSQAYRCTRRPTTIVVASGNSSTSLGCPVTRFINMKRRWRHRGIDASLDRRRTGSDTT